MAFWLYKSEPSTWSWQQQVEAGPAGTVWDGVRNHAAKLNLLAMRVGDRGFFYHSNEGKAIVGIVRVIGAAESDASAPPGSPWVAVRLAADTPLPRPVTLEAIKADPRLSAMALVRQSRLSVQPVTDEEWAIVCAMGAPEA